MMQPLRLLGSHVTLYINDPLQGQKKERKLKRDMIITFCVKSALGWFIKLKKTSLLPMQREDCLDRTVDTIGGHLLLC